MFVKKGKTSKCLANVLGKTPCIVGKWCQNIVQPDLNTHAQIAKTLNVKVAELINEPID